MTHSTQNFTGTVKANGYPFNSTGNCGIFGTIYHDGDDWSPSQHGNKLLWHTYQKGATTTVQQQFTVVRKADGVRHLTTMGAAYSYGNYVQATVPTDLAVWTAAARGVREHSFNLGVSLGESRESLSMVFGSMRRVLSAIRALKQHNWSEVANQLSLIVVQYTPTKVHLKDKHGKVRKHSRNPGPKDISSTWLGLQYGWKPLLSDIFNAMDALEAVRKRPRFKQHKFSTRNKGSWTTSLNGEPGLKDFKRSKTLYLRITEYPSVSASLGLNNPASILWELVPLSFVFDWFLPVGDWLDAVGFRGSIEGTAAICTAETANYDMVNSTLYVGSTYHKGDAGVGKHSRRHRNYTRGPMVAITALGSGMGRLPLPTVNDPQWIASKRHFADLTALAYQIFR